MKDYLTRNEEAQVGQGDEFVTAKVKVSNLTVVADPDMRYELIAKTIESIINQRRRQKGNITPEQIIAQFELMLRITPSKVARRYDGSFDIDLIPSKSA